MATLDHMHDEIDFVESMNEKLRKEMVDIKELIKKTARNIKTIDELMELLDEANIRTASSLADITTESARGGLDLGEKR
jgi:hypothetical protein